MTAATRGTAQRSTPLLEVEGLQTYYGNSHVLHGVSLRVEPGQAVCLMGRNGMGKTTTLRSILGLTRAREGVVRIKGVDMSAAPTHRVVRQGIGYVPEGRGMFTNLNVRESLVMAARPGPGGREDWDLDAVLTVFPRLAERMGHMAGNLSGGEQQMLAIGRALMTNPDLLILDEATEGLAPLIRREIWRVIAQVKDTGIATLIVDKNVGVLLGLADRAVIMVKGTVVYDGGADELKGQPDVLARHIGL